MSVLSLYFVLTNLFFTLYITLDGFVLITSFLFGIHALKQSENECENEQVPISIILPAYNEEKTILSTIHSLLQLHYPIYEILIVDDGSTDQTRTLLKSVYDLKPITLTVSKTLPCKQAKSIEQCQIQAITLTLLEKENGGKADALNLGITYSRYPYFVCTDADSVLDKEALRLISKPIRNHSNVIAVGGSVFPHNGILHAGSHASLPWGILGGLQALEYQKSFLTSRIFFNWFESSLIISGAFGLFQKEITMKVGGYDVKNLGEDMELVMKFHAYCLNNHIPYKIQQVSKAICWTDVPSTVYDLYRQRRRWHIGLLQTMKKYAFLSKISKYRYVALSYDYFLFYEAYAPHIERFGCFTILLSLITGFGILKPMILSALLYLLISTLITTILFLFQNHTDHLPTRIKETGKVIILSILETTLYHSFLSLVRFHSSSINQLSVYIW